MNAKLKFRLTDFQYADLYVPERLPRLDDAFRAYLTRQDSDLAVHFSHYRATDGQSSEETSALLISVARHLEGFLGMVFGLDEALAQLRASYLEQEVIARFKDKFVKKALLAPMTWDDREFEALDLGLTALMAPIEADREGQVAYFWQQAELAAQSASLELLQHWVQAAVSTTIGRKATQGWVSLRTPRRRDFKQLVAIEQPVDASAIGVRGPTERQRRRDGFALTDSRYSVRQVRDQVQDCKYCHEHQGDYCSTGFPSRGTGTVRRNPLGVSLEGCPLKEKISEANLLVREGYVLGALAIIMIDNPLVPATGHRICNDCMKSCIYQKQDPVDIPQIETRLLTDVLSLPWGYELYYCLTRWNPLNRQCPYAKPYHGTNVLCVGAGPAGFNLAYHLLQNGFGVVAIDGLKIEPLPESWTGTPSCDPQPIERIETLRESLDQRVMTGFGGVAEYGITVRWDKNFLKVIYLTLARNLYFNVYGGIRFGGTLTIDDAWRFGFDHIALATGAGRPTLVPIKENLAHGIRQASDFLMALQLTGAAKVSSLANMQVRLPALVIGGGLTAIDTATEVQAYYIRQVEKLLTRYEALGAQAVETTLMAGEREIVAEYLEHGRQVRELRGRAQRRGETPDFTSLIQEWGGVTVVYRRRMVESPAYLRNHEEIEKALEEGIIYAEGLQPQEALLDACGHVRGMRFTRLLLDESARCRDVTLPARSIFMAAGSVPNTAYEREHPGTFEMEGDFYAGFSAEGIPVTGEITGEPGLFTSYRQGKRRITYLGDNHPRYHGSVVRAMASGRDGAQAIVSLFDTEIATARFADTKLRERRWQTFVRHLDDALCPKVLGTRRLGTGLMSITLHAPQATRNWKPGQVYRLQNFETLAERRGPTLLQMEGMAVDGVRVDPDRGEVTLLVNEVGTSSRIAARLQPGEPVVLMGPTGTGLPVPTGKTITVIGGHSAVTSLIDGTALWRQAGNQVILVGHFPDRVRADALKELVQEAADQIIWILDEGPALVQMRSQDVCVLGGMAHYLDQAQGNTSGSYRWLQESDELIISDKAEVMGEIVKALKYRLVSLLKPGVKGTAVVNSPMQCMLKEVCAQCLCRHQPSNGSSESEVVFSCFNQHQDLYVVDFENLKARQNQNRVQEKISALWLNQLLNDAPPPEKNTDWQDVPAQAI